MLLDVPGTAGANGAGSVTDVPGTAGANGAGPGTGSTGVCSSDHTSVQLRQKKEGSHACCCGTKNEICKEIEQNNNNQYLPIVPSLKDNINSTGVTADKIGICSCASSAPGEHNNNNGGGGDDTSGAKQAAACGCPKTETPTYNSTNDTSGEHYP